MPPGPTYQASLDALIDRIERQAVDAREKPRARFARIRPGRDERLPRNPGSTDESEAVGRIVKTKRFAIEQMSRRTPSRGWRNWDITSSSS